MASFGLSSEVLAQVMGGEMDRKKCVKVTVYLTGEDANYSNVCNFKASGGNSLKLETSERWLKVIEVGKDGVAWYAELAVFSIYSVSYAEKEYE